MKKIKFLMPMLGVSSIVATALPLASCGNSSSISFDTSAVTLTTGGYIKLNAKTTSGKEITWKSENEGVAKVANGGWVKAIAEGTTKIVATADGKSATCEVRVSDEEVKPSDSDVNYLTFINSYMTSGSKYATPHKVISTLKDIGYDVINYKLSNIKFEFAFDAHVKKFIIMNGDEVAAAPDNYVMENTQMVFKFTDSYNADSKYGQYLLDNYTWTDSTAVFNFKTSIDVGNNTHIKVMKYTGDQNAKKTVLFRTHCEVINMDGFDDTIYHFGVANNAYVTGRTGTSSCNYYEIGTVGYLYPCYTTLNITAVDDKDYGYIDCLEVGNKVTAGENFDDSLFTIYVGENIIGYTGETGARSKTDITTVETWDEIKEVTSSAFVRLEDDIEITGDDTITGWSIGDNVTIMLDLNGHKITDKSTKATSLSNALIKVTGNGSLTLMDCERTGSINFDSGHRIEVEGTSGEVKVAKLYLNGIYLNYTVGSFGTSAIKLGGTNCPEDLSENAKLFMYGGKITATGTDAGESFGIYAAKNSYVQIVYGSIEAVKGTCISGNGSSDNTYIDITDGNFKADSLCIYQPQGGELHISGGNFEAPCVLGAKDGDIVISGGYFHATGDPKEGPMEPSKPSGIDTDGSVFVFDLQGAKSGYGNNPSITITNASIVSNKSYVIRIFGAVDETKFKGFADFDFFGGTYYFAKGNGIDVSDTASSHTRLNQYGGSWINTSEE